MKNYSGFTLIEIVIVIVIVGVIAGIAAMIIMQGVQAYSDAGYRSDLHYQARLAMDRMAREIRQIRSQADISTMTGADLRFTDVTGAGSGFTFANPDITQWNGLASSTLATGITAFNFNYLQQDGVTAALSAATLWFVDISMTARQGPETLQVRTRVHPRNF